MLEIQPGFPRCPPFTEVGSFGEKSPDRDKSLALAESGGRDAGSLTSRRIEVFLACEGLGDSSLCGGLAEGSDLGSNVLHPLCAIGMKAEVDCSDTDARANP